MNCNLITVTDIWTGYFLMPVHGGIYNKPVLEKTVGYPIPVEIEDKFEKQKAKRMDKEINKGIKDPVKKALADKTYMAVDESAARANDYTNPLKVKIKHQIKDNVKEKKNKSKKNRKAKKGRK